jgi:hypothetical protein
MDAGVALFKKKVIDPVEMLRASLIAYKQVWETLTQMPAKQQQAGLANIPNGLREKYRKAKAVDSVRADGLVTDARKLSLKAQPTQMSWQQLLDYAVA